MSLPVKAAVLFCVAFTLIECGVPRPPLTDPYYPFDVPRGNYPCDWPNSDWAGKPYQHMRSSATPMKRWAGYGFLTWIALADQSKGEQRGNLWALKLGQLPCDYSYTPETPIEVSFIDKIRVFVQEGFELVRLKDATAFSTCNVGNTEVMASALVDSVFPEKISDTYVEQEVYPCRTTGVLNPWSCTSISSSASNIEYNPLNPGGRYTSLFNKSITLEFMSADIGKNLYFADRTRCTTTKFQVKVKAGKIIFVPWTEHTERFQHDGWLQNAYDKGLTVGPADEVWFTTATYEHNIHRVFNSSLWTGQCTALGGLSIQAAQAKLLDVADERWLYYPSNSPQARHLWKFEASRFLAADGEQAYLGCYNVFHECCCSANNTMLVPGACPVTHCNMGPAGGQRISVRRADRLSLMGSGAPSGSRPHGLLVLAGIGIAAVIDRRLH